MCHERGAAQRYLFAVAQHPVDRMCLSAWLDRLERWHVLSHDHHLSAGQLFDQRITFLMVAVRVGSEHDAGTSANLKPSCVTDFSIVRTFLS